LLLFVCVDNVNFLKWYSLEHSRTVLLVEWFWLQKHY
jgi:hypothetical protein